jgi:hypothetical protein
MNFPPQWSRQKHVDAKMHHYISTLLCEFTKPVPHRVGSADRSDGSMRLVLTGLTTKITECLPGRVPIGAGTP